MKYVYRLIIIFIIYIGFIKPYIDNDFDNMAFGIFKNFNNNISSKNTYTNYTTKEKKIIETCKHYAKTEFRAKFNGDLTECHIFLSEYRKSLNDQIKFTGNMLYESIKYSNLSSNTKTKLFTKTSADLKKADCRLKPFYDKSAEYIIECIAVLQYTPKKFKGAFTIVNDYNREQRANRYNLNTQRSTGDKLIEMGLILMGTGSGSGGSSGSNFNTKCSYTGSSTSGPTTTCSYNCAGKRKVISQTNNPICPYNVKGSIF